VHAKLYKEMLENLDKQTEADIYVCTVCGNIHIGSAPETCSICNAGAKAFKKIE